MEWVLLRVGEKPTSAELEHWDREPCFPSEPNKSITWGSSLWSSLQMLFPDT